MKSKKDLLSTKHVLLRHTLFGTISGFVAGILMTPFLIKCLKIPKNPELQVQTAKITMLFDDQQRVVQRCTSILKY